MPYELTETGMRVWNPWDAAGNYLGTEEQYQEQQQAKPYFDPSTKPERDWVAAHPEAKALGNVDIGGVSTLYQLPDDDYYYRGQKADYTSETAQRALANTTYEQQRKIAENDAWSAGISQNMALVGGAMLAGAFSFGSLAGAVAPEAAGGWISAEGGAGYLGGMAADASELAAAAGTATGVVDQVGSDWATGQATGPTGGLLETTPEGLTAANTQAASGVPGSVNSGTPTPPPAASNETLTGSKAGDFVAKQAAGSVVKGLISGDPAAPASAASGPKFVAGSVPDLGASFGSLVDLPSAYKNLGPSFRGASNVRK